MGFGQIQFGGLASGLDTSAIISALLSLERRPIQALEGRKQTEEGKLQLYTTFENLVRDLRKKAQELSAGQSFFANTLTVADESVASISVTPGAIAGSHELASVQLAKADRYTFDGVVDPDASLGTGTITFDHRGETYTIDLADASLNDIAAAINNHVQTNAAGDEIHAGDVVTANVVNVGTADSPSYQLVIAGDETGADYAIQNLTVSGVTLTGQTQLTAAQNAIAEIDGLSVQRSTNLFSDVIPGVSFTLTSEQGGAAAPPSTTFTIDVDPEGIKENVQGFVDAYNAVIDFIGKQNELTTDENDDTNTSAASDLFGDPALTSVQSAIRGALFDVPLADIQNDTTGYSTLGLVGIQVGADGRLSIDDAKFDEKLSGDLDAFANLFLEPPALDDNGDLELDANGQPVNRGGVFARLERSLNDLIENQDTPYVDASGQPIVSEGLFNRRRDSINAVIRDLNDQIDALQLRLDKTEESLVQRFANLEQLISGLNAQQAYLNSAFVNQNQR